MRVYRVLEKIKDKFSLTEREFEIMILMVKGYSSLKELSSELKISSSTINNHLDNIYRKFGITGKGELLSFVIGELIDEIDRLEGAVDYSLIDQDVRNQIWIVCEDDQERNRLVAQAIEFGYFVNPLKNYQAVMARLETLKKAPSATILVQNDIKGLSIVMEALRNKFGKRHPFLLIVDEETKVEQFSNLVGNAGFLYKNFDPKVLKSMVDDAIGQSCKRKESRIPVSITMEFWRDTDHAKKIECKTVNVSLHGFAVSLSEKIAHGENVNFNLSFNHCTLEGVAQVSWIKEDSGSTQCGFRITNFAKGFDEYQKYVQARDLAWTGDIKAA